MMTAATNVWPFSSDSPPAVILTSLRSTSRISSLKSWTWIPRRVSRFSSTASLTARRMELVSKKSPAFRLWNSVVPPVRASAGGSRTVENTNVFVRTRARYSRFQISHSLRIRCGDLLDENIVQGGLHKLEPSDFDSVLDRRLKDFLRVSARPQFCLNHRSVTVDAFD